MLTAEDVARLDANSAFLGVPTTELMENAGAAVADRARRLVGPGPMRVVVLCGLGNNGGDGLVAARHLAAEHEVRVLVAGDPAQVKTEEAQRARDALDGRRVRVEGFEDEARVKELVAGANLVIDALLGVGIRGTLREPVRTIVKTANRHKTPVLSVDVPTGLGADLSMRPHATVTFHDRKDGMTKKNSGTVHVADIGIPAEAQSRCGPGDLLAAWDDNRPESHKGQNGRLLIVGGGPYGGAPQLCARAALRLGVDLVRLYTPARVAPVAQAAMPDLVVEWGTHASQLVPADVDLIGGALDDVDAVLVGPGLGTSKATFEAIEGVLHATKEAAVPVVLDADALTAAAGRNELLKGRPVLLTPHAGEYRTFAGTAVPDDVEAAKAALADTARAAGATILLKGSVDRITDGQRHRENHVHHPGMTRGGTGDVLAGAAAALMARGADPFAAASAAAFLVGSAGAGAFEKDGPAALASEIADALGRELAGWARA